MVTSSLRYLFNIVPHRERDAGGMNSSYCVHDNPARQEQRS